MKLFTFISSVFLASLATQSFAAGLSIEIANNTNTPYIGSLSTKTDYEDMQTYPGVCRIKVCDAGYLNLNAHNNAATWCGYKDGRSTGMGGYAIINIKQINSANPYSKVIVAVDDNHIARIIMYSEEARESILHVHANCARLQDHDACKISLDEK